MKKITKKLNRERVLQSRIKKREIEKQFIAQVLKKGWTVSKGILPEFVIWLPTGRPMFVYVKLSKTRGPRNPERVFKLKKYLFALGIKAYFWSPDSDWLSKAKVA